MSIRWNDAPEDDQIRVTFDICRTPPNGSLILDLTCERVFGTCVHFYGGRTVPHTPDEGCEPCQKQREYVWKGYLSAINKKLNDHVIWECTAPIGIRLKAACHTLGSLRGLRIVVSRVGNRPTGRILMRAANELMDSSYLPKPPDVQSIMEHMWERSLDPKTTGNREWVAQNASTIDVLLKTGTDTPSSNGS